MNLLRAGATALACVSLSAAAAPGTMNSGMPPERFRGTGAAVVIFTDRAGIDAMCGIAEPGYTIIACSGFGKDGVPIIVMPNPCPIGDAEFYAKVMCHEKAHTLGWGREHEE